MSPKVNRRAFVKTSTAASLAAAAGPAAFGQAPAVTTPVSKPVAISSANGNKFKNGGDKTCLETAFGQITQGGDGLHPPIARAIIAERSPQEGSVGYAGL